jgi:Uma2 family endonuclease
VFESRFWESINLKSSNLGKSQEAEAMTISTENFTEKKIWTDEAFMALSKDGHRYELVDGEILDMGNSGMEHGGIGSLLGGVLAIYVRQQKLGVVCDSSTAFTLKNGNKRSPDVSFVSRERLKGLKRPPRGFFQGSPDLAVEILSPSNTIEEIHDKIVEYFENDTRLVWVIHPDEKYLLVYHSPEPDRFLRSSDHLDGESVVPGFSMAVSELFEEWDF